MPGNDEPRQGNPIVVRKFKRGVALTRHPSPRLAPSLASSAEAVPAVRLADSLADVAGARRLC